MLGKDCAKVIADIWDEYFAQILAYDKKGMLLSDGKTLYPNMIINTEFQDCFVKELMGTVEAPVKLKRKYRNKKSEKASSYFEVFGSGGEAGVFTLHMYSRFQNLVIGNCATDSDIRARFRFLGDDPTHIIRDGGFGAEIVFADDFLASYFRDLIIVQREGIFARCKVIQDCVVYKKGPRLTKELVATDMMTIFNEGVDGLIDVVGVVTVSNDDVEAYRISAQLQSNFMMKGLHETTLGDFISSNPQILKTALDAEQFLYEPTLEWMEHDGDIEETAINPDLLVQRSDGHYDIYDFKTAFLDTTKLTTGRGSSRKMFIQKVHEGCAQLANYRDYFRFEANRRHAFEKYGVTIENPRLVLIAGSLENIDATEAKQAQRMLDGIEVIDYDTLVTMFLNNGVERLDRVAPT